jgi:hypothetical protein
MMPALLTLCVDGTHCRDILDMELERIEECLKGKLVLQATVPL